MTAIQTKKTKGISKILIDGEFTLSSVSQIKTAILKSFQKSNHLELNLEAVTRLDLAGFQLLCAASKYSEKYKKNLGIAGQVAPSVSIFIQGANYLRIKEGIVDLGNGCHMVIGENS